ncbi:hypothetical protein ACS386_08875 [Flavobacteriaceae bacterium LMO-SS05]
MRKLLFILSLSLLCFNCNDGDLIVFQLDFDNTFKTCGNIVFYKTKTDPAESLSIQISDLTLDQVLAVGSDNTLTLNRTINGSSNRFTYRTYSSLPSGITLFCNDVPPSDLDILTSDESTSGNITITTVLIEDDNDGIPAEFEDINGNGNLDDDDTDGDGIPNYLDQDDDGDNVLTAAENPNYTVADGLANAQDSDGDGIPDYLDMDDDGDGVKTRDEENVSKDQNPLNDILDPNVGPDYLNPNISNTVPATKYRAHSIKQTYMVSILVENISFPTLSQTQFDFGTLNDSSVTSRTRTPIPVFVD